VSKEYERLLGIAREQTLPPVASWDPDRVGEIDIRIRADGVWFHEGDGPNPYFAFLSAADWICVTEDSTNMLCEAAATGAPVYRLGVEGDPGKFRHLYAGLEGVGAVRPYLGRLESWEYEPLHETDRAAQAVLEILA